ncbi:NAD(P)H-dependent oxidoreductase [Mycobacterium sp. NPDC050441]|uniref:NAD(P)H-dependent oxidoreductase n=1 Tax=Mycobacterium sp. NPDC050441 TaxID=3155403 RepID=UPI0033F72F4C
MSSQLAQAYLDAADGVGKVERFSVWDDDMLRFGRPVVSSPMWNWHVPHALKAWIDIIVQPVASFTLNERGEHVGTLGEGKPLQLLLTRSSAYDGRHPELQDFQRPYLEYVFGMLGYRVDTLVVEPTTRWTPAEREQMRTQAVERAREVARTSGA